MQVLAVGRCVSSGGRIMTEGGGWKAASELGSAGLPVQKYTSSCRSSPLSRRSVDQNHRLNRTYTNPTPHWAW